MMETEVLCVDPSNPDPNVIRRAGEIICSGELVAFPTETVYGVGGDAFDPDAAAKLFEAKGRPANNPLPVLIADIDDIVRLADKVPLVAWKLVEAFFPGPLTLVLRASERVPKIVTAGTGNIGIRMPDHPVALAIIKEAGRPLATSSANVSGQPAPMNADEAFAYLNGKIKLLIDGGPTLIGIASTVLDLSGESPSVLRSGAISEEMLQPYLEEL